MQSISNYISLLKTNKAVGHDGLHTAFLKCSGDKDVSPSLCNHLVRISLLVVFLVLLNGLISIPYKRRKITCVNKMIGLSTVWPLSLTYLKDVFVIRWWLSLYLYWIIGYLLLEMIKAASTWFYNSPNFGANPLIKEIVWDLWQWICQRPVTACHLDF